MKTLDQAILALAIAACTASPVSALTVTQTTDPAALGALLSGSGVTVDSVTINNGAGMQFGSYSGFDSGPLTLGNGVVISTGQAVQTTAAYHSTGDYPSSNTGVNGTAEFNNYAAGRVTNFSAGYDVASLTVYFTLPAASAVKFDWAFGSVEYPVYTNQFTDAFFAFLDGTDAANQIVFDSNGNPVQVGASFGASLIVNDTNTAFSNPHGIMGLTTTTGTLAAGPHSLTFVIGDVNDHVLDTAVFISSISTTDGDDGTVPTDSTPPVVTPPSNVTAKATSPSGAMVVYPPATATDNVAVTSLTYSQESGTVFPIGITTVTVTAKDAANNTSTATFTVTVTAADPVLTLLVATGTDGTVVAGESQGTSYKKLGLPSINDAGRLAFAAQITGTDAKFSAILTGTEPTVLVRSGDTADGTGGATFKSFKDPLFNQAGAVAFVGKITGPGVASGSDQGIWSDAFGGGPRLVARKGDIAVGGGGAAFSQFKSVALESGTGGAPMVAYQAKLAGAGVTTGADDGLWSYDGTTTRVLLREGTDLLVSGAMKKLTKFIVLAKLPMVSGQGFGLSEGVMSALLSFDDKTAAVAVVHADGSEPAVVALVGDPAPGYDAGAAFNSMKPPGQNSVGGSVFTATVSGSMNSTEKAALYAVTGGVGGELDRIAVKGEAAAGLASGAVFKAFKAAVNNQEDCVAFMATAEKGGVVSASDTGVWIWDDTDIVHVAQEGAEAAECGGATWKGFTALALPDNGRPLFVGTMNVGTGIPVVSTNNDTALWGVDIYGDLRLLVREGMTSVGGKTVKSFKVLSAVVGSPSQTRSHNATGGIVCWAAFTDRTQGLIKVQMP
jgi:hypothetical protein